MGPLALQNVSGVDQFFVPYIFPAALYTTTGVTNKNARSDDTNLPDWKLRDPEIQNISCIKFYKCLQVIRHYSSIMFHLKYY